MKYEVLKRSHLKKNIIIALIVVGVISAIVLNFTRAKYRTTESIPLIQGTINFSPSDLNLMAVYLNKNGDTISSDKVPHVGYTLNTEQSICEVNDVEDETIEIVYENGLLNFNGLGNKGTKCTAYFDLIPDSEKPVINNISSKSDNDTSVTIEVNATDNIGIYYYYYKIDNEEEVRTEENSYTFEGLEKNSVHTITVRVEDAAGNISETKSKEVTVGLKGGSFILASKNAPTSHTTDWTGGTTYYYTGKPNNWVQFAGFWWRIIRINGDGTIRMIYQGTDANTTGSETQIGTNAFNDPYRDVCYIGFKYTRGELHGLSNNSTILGEDASNDTTTLNGWYRVNLLKYTDYIDGNAGFCGDRTIYSGSGIYPEETYYSAYNRVENENMPSLQCDIRDIYTTTNSSDGNKSLQYPIGLVTVDELFLSESLNSTSSYLYTGQQFWTMTPCYTSGYAVLYFADPRGYFYNANADSDMGVRPVINLKSSIAITGSGTTTDPFKVVGAS